MICPVCKTECGDNAVCPKCGFYEVGRTFINREEAEQWYNDTVITYRDDYLECHSCLKIENNALVKFKKEYKQTTQIRIPNGINEIFNYAFQECSWVTDIFMPDTVKEIGTGVFRKCWSLTNINIPTGVIKFGKSVFSDCINLTSIFLPDEMAEITYRMFFGCQALSSISIPKSVKKIGWQAFLECYSLSTLIIPDNVKVIEEDAFGFCTSLKYLKIGTGTRKIGEDAFHYCGKLISIETNNNARYVVKGNSLIDKKHSKLLRACDSSVIPYGIKVIGKGAFSGCEKISKIMIPSSVTKIGSGAFSSCVSLSSIVIPQSVKIIGYNALLTDFKTHLKVYCEHISKPGGWHDVWFNKFDSLTGNKQCVYWNGQWHYDENGEPVPDEELT